MVRRCSRVATRSRSLRRGGRRKCDRCIALQLVMAVNDNAFAAVEPRGNGNQVASCRAALNGARLRTIVGSNGPDKKPGRPTLYGGRGDDDGIAASFEQHPRVDELAGPQLVVLVRKHRLEPDSRG